MASSSFSNQNFNAKDLKSIQKNISELAIEYDFDFQEICSPSVSEEQKTLRNLVKYAISLKSYTDPEQRHSEMEKVEEKLDDIFKMQLQGSKCITNDKSSLEELEADINIVNEAITCLSEVREDNKQINMRKIQEDFIEQRNIMNNTTITIFKEKADDVIKILNDLFHTHFSKDCQYLDISSAKYNQDVVEILTHLGIIELDPSDKQKVKFLDLNG